ncbi:MAG: hypothetical protein H7249_13865 [Chitinophagaceae bacterium]|nr:hypothetical protein [Oligoflexus sp.]
MGALINILILGLALPLQLMSYVATINHLLEVRSHTISSDHRSDDDDDITIEAGSYSPFEHHHDSNSPLHCHAKDLGSSTFFNIVPPPAGIEGSSICLPSFKSSIEIRLVVTRSPLNELLRPPIS